jgi:uracil-DNA glycosylase family 4
MSFDSLVQIDTKPKATPKKKIVAGLGCSACPAKKTWKMGINPVKGKVRGKKLFIIAQNPGFNENKEGKELVGASGEWLWAEMKKVGLRRKDCDIQNAVRCLTIDGKDPDTGRLNARTPNKEEIACCSKYTTRAIAKSKAKVYIIFGEIAARQVCGREFKKEQRIFWSDTLKAKVYCLDHPSFFLRGGSNKRLTQFRVGLSAAAAEVTGKHKGDPRYAVFAKQDYKWITTIEEAEKEARYIRKAGNKGIQVSFDSEDDYLDEYGQRMPLVMGTCFKPGRARLFGLYHPELKMSDRVRAKMLEIVASLLEDKNIPKVLHHGVSDDEVSREMFGVKISNYHSDTEISSFFNDPNRKQYGLKGLADTEFPEFSGYASVIIPYAIPKELPEDASDELKKKFALLPKKTPQEQYDWCRARGYLRYSQVPLKQLLLYNGADSDLCKRLQLKTKHVSAPLMRVYVDAAWVLHRMQQNGPVFDFDHSAKLRSIFEPRLKAIEKEIKEIAGKDFNPRSPQQVYHYVYNVLKLKYPFPIRKPTDKPNTAKDTMAFLGRKNRFCLLISQYRKVAKIVTTYLESFAKCAREHEGRLRTRWNLTGTATGRLSSGGGNKKDAVESLINLQNVHSDPLLQNQCVPSKKWRKCYDACSKALKKTIGTRLTAKLAKYANKSEKLYDKRDDKTGKVTFVGLLSRAKAKLKSSRWKKIARKLILAFASTQIFLAFDFGQIEVRVLAQLSGDKNLIADCKSGDIHSKVGHAMTGWAVEKIKKDKKTRTLTKNIHFGIAFGLNAEGVYAFILAKDPDIQVTLEDVQRYYAAYFARYPGVRTLTDKLRELAEQKGYVENIFGFQRPLNTSGQAEEGDTGAYWGNQAINTPIQGTAHQLMLMALAALRLKKKMYKMLGIPTMEVHDALYFFVKLKDLIKAYALGKNLLETEPLATVSKLFKKIKFLGKRVHWDMPLEVEGEAGFRLGDTVEVERDGEMISEEEALAEMTLETLMKENMLELELAA